jgi:hypothetical protein
LQVAFFPSKRAAGEVVQYKDPEEILNAFVSNSIVQVR